MPARPKQIQGERAYESAPLRRRSRQLRGGLVIEYIIVTNNERCQAYYRDQIRVLYDAEWSYLDVLLRVRDLVHQGVSLVTHPLAGSLKPNQTPFRSVVLSSDTLEDKSPWQDVLLVENSIQSLEKFFRFRGLPDWPDAIQKDFRTLDLSFIQGAIKQHIPCAQ